MLLAVHVVYSKQVNNPGPKDPAFFAPQRGGK
jgi:hypothetical protein